MNRRDFVTRALVGSVGLLAPSWPWSAAAAAPTFKTHTHYWLGTALWIDDGCEWDSEPVMRITTDDGAEAWSWCVNQYNEEEPPHAEVNRDVPGAGSPDCFGPLGNMDVRRWNDFRWHLYFSSGDDGLMEGWCNGRKTLAVAGPNVDADFLALTFERSKSDCMRLSRPQWRVGNE